MPGTRAEPCVLLFHTLPGGGSHFDLMLAPDGVSRLVTFRVESDVSILSTSAFAAERLGDHRRDYLTYEGPLSNDRGSVVRVRAGRAVILENTPARFVAVVDWGAGPIRLEGVPGGGEGRWRFEAGAQAARP